MKSALEKPGHLISSTQDGWVLREARAGEMQSIFLMGIDAWGLDGSIEHYLKACHESTKYSTGRWFVLADCAGELVCSVIAYKLPGILEKTVIGIGSLATVPAKRSNGHALKCMLMLIKAYEVQHGVPVFILFCDVLTGIYNTAGFTRHERPADQADQAVLMIRAEASDRLTIYELLVASNIRYF